MIIFRGASPDIDNEYCVYNVSKDNSAFEIYGENDWFWCFDPDNEESGSLWSVRDGWGEWII